MRKRHADLLVLDEIWDFLGEWDGPMTMHNARENIPAFTTAVRDLLAFLKEHGYEPKCPASS